MIKMLPAVEPTTIRDAMLHWPAKFDLFGLQVSAVEYDEAVSCIVDAASASVPAVVSCHAVHAVVTISGNADLCRAANEFAMITPDGQPVRWALNALYRCKLKERVYGPELMWRVLRESATNAIPVYFYGASPEVLKALVGKVQTSFPGLRIAGSESPPYRELTEAELTEVASRINGSGAGIVFIGLGCPKQDRFAAAQAKRIRAVQICVGAAFDFHAGTKPMAPRWMQNAGLEWLFRLASEPRRLFSRYMITNSQFIFRFIGSLLARRGTMPSRDPFTDGESLSK